MNSIKSAIKNAGWPRIIIALFLLSMYLISPFIGINLKTALGDTLVRFGMNAILVLSLVPMIQSGTGLNFGMPLLVNAGLCAVRREMAVCGAITAVLSALAFAALSSSAGTGICLNPEMACHVTASFVKALGGIGILIGLLCTYMGVKAGK